MSDPFRILVTGSRRCTRDQIEFVWRTLRAVAAPAAAAGRLVIVVQGECPYGGVDHAARTWAESEPGVDFEGHPAAWDVHGRAAGPIRNGEMVKLGADVCVGFPAIGSRGTWDCLRRAADAGIPVQVYSLGMAG